MRMDKWWWARTPEREARLTKVMDEVIEDLWEDQEPHPEEVMEEAATRLMREGDKLTWLYELAEEKLVCKNNEILGIRGKTK